MCLNMAASHGTHCILNLAPASCLTCAFCGHHAPWSSCHGVFTLLYSPILRAPYKIPRHTRVASTPSPHPLLVRQKEFLSWFLFIFFLYLTGVPRHRPSFLHGGLVSNYSLASGDLLRCVAGVRKDLFCLCHSRRNLALICSSGPPPNPVPSLVVGRELSAAVWSLPPSSQSPSPSPSSEAF